MKSFNDERKAVLQRLQDGVNEPNMLHSPQVLAHPFLEVETGCGERSVQLSATSVEAAKDGRQRFHNLEHMPLGGLITLSKANTVCFTALLDALSMYRLHKPKKSKFLENTIM